MAEKKIQVRIRQKVDTKANWDKATNFVPLKGEYIYYSDLHKVKVGDGVTKVGALPFLADSNSITGMYVGATNAKANAATTNGNTYLKLYDDSTKRAEFKIVGSGATKVSSDANGNITISSTDTHQSVADKNPTLAWGAKSTVATIGNTDIHVTMPANPDTHLTTGLYVGKASEKSNSATTNGNTYLKLFDNDTKRAQHLINGTGLTTVASDASGTITINSTLPTNLVTTDTEQTVTGTKRFNAITANTIGTGKITVSSQGISEDDVYCEITSTGVQLMDQGAGTSYNVNYMDVNGFKVYLPNATYMPSGAEVFAMKSNLSNLLDKGTSSTTVTQTVHNPVELKKGLTGNGSFVWTGPDESPLDVKFNVKSTQAAETLGYPAETAVMSLSATPLGPVTLELFTHSTNSDVAIKLNQEGYATTIGVNGITIGGDKNLSWPTYGGALLTNGYFANANATDPSANEGKIPALESPGTIPLKFIKPVVSMYASESDLPGGIQFSPSYVPDALYVTKDTNSIYRYNQDTESYVKLGSDIRSEQWKLTSISGAVRTVNICVK